MLRELARKNPVVMMTVFATAPKPSSPITPSSAIPGNKDGIETIATAIGSRPASRFRIVRLTLPATFGVMTGALLAQSCEDNKLFTSRYRYQDCRHLIQLRNGAPY